MEELDEADMGLIATAQFTRIPPTLLARMIGFTRALQREVVVLRRFGARGSPWDFNLRDLFRWCELMQAEQRAPHWQPWAFVDALFLQRMRTADDRRDPSSSRRPRDAPAFTKPPTSPSQSVQTR